MKRYFIYLAYNGKNYCGWQYQPNGITVQDRLEEALSILLREKLEVTGAGRTDSGVHARKMIAHFDYAEEFDCSSLCKKLNRMLPGDIAIEKIQPVRPDAHARFNAVSRTYHYYISDKKDPFLNEYTYKVSRLPDFKAMNEAAKILFEYRDFTSFSKLHTDVKTNNCIILQAEWKQEGERWVFIIRADRFLRNMVRAIVGTLLEIGQGKMNMEDFKRVIEEKDRCKAGSSVPGRALFLVDVEYPEELFEQEKK